MVLYAQPRFEVYKDGIHHKADRFKSEQQEYYPIEKIEYGNELGNEIYIWKRGLKYPTKGFTSPEALEAINIAKRIVLYAVFSQSPLLIFKKYRNKAITLLNRAAYYVVEPYLIKTELQTKSAKEFAKLIKCFLIEFGINPYEAEKTGEVMGAIIQYDDAYRYRLEDIFNEAREKIDKKELKRLFSIQVERDLPGVWLKTKKFLKLLNLISNKKIKDTFKQINIKNLALDEIESYHVLFRGDYMFNGKSFEERQKELANLHNGKVPEQFINEI